MLAYLRKFPAVFVHGVFPGTILATTDAITLGSCSPAVPSSA